MTEYSCCIADSGCRELGYPPIIEQTLATIHVNSNLVGADLALALVPLIEAGEAQRQRWMIIRDDLEIPEALRSLATGLWEHPPSESVFEARGLHRSLRTLVRAVGASSASVEDGRLLGFGAAATALLESAGLQGTYTVRNVTEVCRFLSPLRGELRLEFQDATLALVSRRAQLEVGRPTMDIPYDTDQPTLALRVPRSALIAATSDCVRRDQRYLLEYFSNELTLAGPNDRTAIPFHAEEELAPIVARSFSGRALRQAAATFESEELELGVYGRWNRSGAIRLRGTVASNDVLEVTIPAASYKELRHRLRTSAAPPTKTATPSLPSECDPHELQHELVWTVDIHGSYVSIPATCRGCQRGTKVGLDIRNALQCGAQLDMRRIAFDLMSRSRYHAEVGTRRRVSEAFSEWVLSRRRYWPALAPSDLLRIVAATSSEMRAAHDLSSSLAGHDAAERSLIQQMVSGLAEWRAERATVGLEASCFEAQGAMLHDLAYWSPITFAALLGIELHEPSTKYLDRNDETDADLDLTLLQPD